MKGQERRDETDLSARSLGKRCATGLMLVGLATLTVAGEPQRGSGKSASTSGESTAPTSKGAAEPNRPIRISTKGIVCRENGDPVAGATVFLKDCPFDIVRMVRHARLRENDIVAQTTTNQGGEFQFEQVAVEGYFATFDPTMSLVARAEGLGLAWKQLESHDRDEVRLVMSPPAQVRGRLVAEAGVPIHGVTLRAIDLKRLDEEPDDGFRRSLELSPSKLVLSATTDAMGRFVIEGLPVDHRVALRVEHPELERSRIYAATTDKPQPAIKDPLSRPSDDDVQLVSVHTGEFSARVARGRIVQGRVICTDTRKPAVGMPVVIQKPSPFDLYEDRYYGVCDGNGRFRITGLPGLSAGTEHPFGGRPVLTVRQAADSPYIGVQIGFVVDSPTTTVDVELPRAVALTGIVVDDTTGQGVPGVQVDYETAPNARGNRDRDTTYLCYNVRTDGLGRFSLLVPAGRGKVGISGSVPPYLLPEYGPFLEGERFQKAVNIVATQKPPVLRFEIGRGNVVRGRVKDADGAPLAGAQILEYGWDAGESPAITTSDASGNYVLTGVTDHPIRFLLAIHQERKLKSVTRIPASKPGEKPGEIALDLVVHPEGAIKARLLAGGKPLTGDAVQVNLGERVPVMHGTTESEGTRTLNDRIYSEPIPGANGWKRPILRIPLVAHDTVDADGNLFIPIFAANWKYYLILSAPGFQLFSRDLRLKPGEVRDLGTIELVRARKVTVAVMDSAGKPVPVAMVWFSNDRSGGYTGITSDARGRVTLSDVVDSQNLVICPSFLGNGDFGNNSERDRESEISVPTGVTEVKLVMRSSPKPKPEPTRK